MNTVAARLYETDFYGWIQNQADVLRSGNLDSLDLENLIEEVESMGKSQKRSLTSRLEVLLMHLLKWQYQPSLRGSSWQFTIEEQRVRIAENLSENPSLKSQIPACMQTAYQHAKRLAARETGLAGSAFPPECPWTFDLAMDGDFWPENEALRP